MERSGENGEVEELHPYCNERISTALCNTVRVPYAPRRVVSLQPSATVTLRDLGKLDSLVACTKYCVAVCPELSERHVPIVADSWTAQAQQIAAAHPDLVIGSVPYQEKALAEIMKCGARFLGLAPKSLTDIYSDIAMIAGIMDAADAANKTIAVMQAEIESARQKTERLPKPKVFCEEWGKPLIASQGWVAELVEAAGGEFLGAAGTQTDFAAVVHAEPDVLIAAWCGAGDRVPLEKTVAARGWQDLKAVRNRHVYCVRDEYLNTPASTLLNGLRALLSAIHPEHFPQASGLRSIGAL